MVGDGAAEAVGSTMPVVQPINVDRTTSAAMPRVRRPRSVTRSAGVDVRHGSDYLHRRSIGGSAAGLRAGPSNAGPRLWRTSTARISPVMAVAPSREGRATGIRTLVQSPGWFCITHRRCALTLKNGDVVRVRVMYRPPSPAAGHSRFGRDRRRRPQPSLSMSRTVRSNSSMSRGSFAGLPRNAVTSAR